MQQHARCMRPAVHPSVNAALGPSDVTQDVRHFAKLASYIVLFSEEKFITKQVRCDKNNDNAQDFQSTILLEFPELSAYTNVFTLWVLRGNTTTLTPLPAEINSFAALHRHAKQINRSLIYITPVVSSLFIYFD
jgi:hypothetical protein